MCHHVATGRQAKEEKEMFRHRLTIQERGAEAAKEGGKKKKREKKTATKGNWNQPRSCYCCWFVQLKRYSPPLFTKTQINSDTMLMMAMHPWISTYAPPVAGRNSISHGTLHLSYPSLTPFLSAESIFPLLCHCHDTPNRPTGLEVSCGQSCGERLTLQD